MNPWLLALLFTSVPLAALANPPTVGTVGYSFNDPVLGSVVICDELHQLQAIANADNAQLAFQALNKQLNSAGKPTCVTGVLSADVLDVKPIGLMDVAEHKFNAWGIQIGKTGQTRWLLYLEAFNGVIA